MFFFSPWAIAHTSSPKPWQRRLDQARLVICAQALCTYPDVHGAYRPQVHPSSNGSPGWGLFAKPCTAPIRRAAGATARRLINTGESGCRCGTLASWPLEREREYAGKRNGKRGEITDRIRVQISKRDPVKPLAKAVSRIIAGCYAATSSCLLSGNAMQNIAPLLSLLVAQILP